MVTVWRENKVYHGSHYGNQVNQETIVQLEYVFINLKEKVSFQNLNPLSMASLFLISKY